MAAAGGKPRSINLALQGGGSHGAFTWGVLDRLLEEPDLHIDAISGTSAGAMNGVALAHGMAHGGADGAKRSLAQFWRRISRMGSIGPMPRTPLDRLAGRWNLDRSPAFWAFDLMTRFLSPYQFNPFDWNPLHRTLDELFDFAALREKCAPRLFVTATNVRSGKIKVFKPQELTSDVCMASACLPFLYRAVEIDGEAYWDGGYSGNPAIYPLIYQSDVRDVVIVQLNPLNRDEVPQSTTAIVDRLNEVTFNAGLMREMRAIEFVTRLIEEGKLDEQHYKRIFVHMIGGADDLDDLGHSSKLNADWDFLLYLRDLGRKDADRWLVDHGDAIGQKSSIDIREVFL